MLHLKNSFWLTIARHGPSFPGNPILDLWYGCAKHLRFCFKTQNLCTKVGV